MVLRQGRQSTNSSYGKCDGLTRTWSSLWTSFPPSRPLLTDFTTRRASFYGGPRIAFRVPSSGPSALVSASFFQSLSDVFSFFDYYFLPLYCFLLHLETAAKSRREESVILVDMLEKSKVRFA